MLYDFDLPEHVILVSDWLGELGMAKFVAHHHDDGDNKPPSMIVNGKGRVPKPAHQLTANETMPLSRFSVQKVSPSTTRNSVSLEGNVCLSLRIIFFGYFESHHSSLVAPGCPLRKRSRESDVTFCFLFE